jgi:hypothetical protein
MTSYQTSGVIKVNAILSCANEKQSGFVSGLKANSRDR